LRIIDKGGVPGGYVGGEKSRFSGGIGARETVLKRNRFCADGLPGVRRGPFWGGGEGKENVSKITGRRRTHKIEKKKRGCNHIGEEPGLQG